MNSRVRLALAVLLPLAAGALASRATEIPLNERRSAYEDMSRDNKAMQDDDTSNPGMLAVLDGEALWSAPAGASGKSCADCHGDAKASMKGVAARHPAFNGNANRPVNLEQRINLSREQDQKAPPFAYESREMPPFSPSAPRQPRGEPIAPPADPR